MPDQTNSRSALKLERWLAWAWEIQALAQTGNHYAENDYQRERYRRLIEIAAEIVSETSSLDFQATNNAYQTQFGYATPRIDVRAAVFHDSKLLLVRERDDKAWTMPGGWADVGDLPSKSAEREAWEEAGVRVAAKRVIGVYDANRIPPVELFHAFKIVFLCDWIGGDLKASHETSEAAFFSYDSIPSELSPERTQRRQIEDAFLAYARPELPTVFD